MPAHDEKRVEILAPNGARDLGRIAPGERGRRRVMSAILQKLRTVTGNQIDVPDKRHTKAYSLFLRTRSMREEDSEVQILSFGELAKDRRVVLHRMSGEYAQPNPLRHARLPPGRH